MSDHKIDISWKLTPVSATGEVQVPDAPIQSTAKDQALAEQLGWHRDTIAVLRHCFDRKLGRFDAWLPQGQYVDQAAIKDAAAVYRRGVQFAGETERDQETGSYGICFETDHLIFYNDQTFVLADANFKKLNPQLNWPPKTFVWESSEERKNLESVAEMLLEWERLGKPEYWTIYGGGTLSDTAGFAAALVGCRFTFVPTTLLAMVDACVGGKTGVNFFPYGKNQLGLFDFPEQVVICSKFLETLPRRHIDAGGAECLKHAILSGKRDLVQIVMQRLSLDPVNFSMEQLIKIINVKAEIVGRDPNESGERAALNLGHTLAHALESYVFAKGNSEHLYHGEAVGAGLFFMSILSEDAGYLDHDVGNKMRVALQESTVLPSRSQLNKALGTPLPQFDLQLLLPHLSQDKKNKGNSTRWVLLSDWGALVRDGKDFTVKVDDAKVEAAWKRFVSEYVI